MAQATSLLNSLPATDFSQVAPRSSDTPTAGEGGQSASVQVGLAEAAHQHAFAQAAARATAIQGFGQPSNELVSLTYAGLHDPAHAGLVPVSLGETTYRNARVPCIVFDWDGVQYTYQPDRGTTGQPIPINALTGLPDLCVRNGALLECVYFCAVFGKQHPGSSPAMIPGEPIAVAYQTDGKLGLFIPTLGGFSLPSQYLKALADPEYLGQIRDQVVTAKKPQARAADAIPEEMQGDDGDLQMRRAFLACQAAGIPCQLNENGAPSLAFTWNGIAYAYGSDQQIRSSVATSAPKSPTALVGPAINLAETKAVQVAEPVIPDNTPDLPELKMAPLPEPTPTPQADATGPTAASAPLDKLVMLPPMVVSTTRITKNPWRYVSIPGFEVLSRASEAATSWDLDGLRHGLWIQRAVIPKEWLPELPVPCTDILDDTDLMSLRADQPHSQQVAFKAPPDALAWGQLSGKTRVSSEPISSDHDTFALNSNLHGLATRGVTYASINLDRLLLAAPPLPPWVIAGLLGRNGLFRDGFAITVPSGGERGFSPIAGSLESANEYAEAASDYSSPAGKLEVASGPGTLWISVAETQLLLRQLKHDKNTKIPMLPLGELFAEAPPSEANRSLWESEAGLLVRWGLMGPGRSDPALFRSFLTVVRRARQEPVTEAVFTECFGFGYATMEVKLESFLKTVLAQPTSIKNLAMPVTFGLPTMKPATADQTGRIIGDWIRMQGETLRPRDPSTARVFLDSAGQMLWRAYRDDNALPSQSPSDAISANLIQDPRLLAVYGLYEHDAGNDAKAREFLEVAVKADVVRPRAYQVLAELRYAEAVAKPQGTRGMFSASQAVSIVEPLKKALRFPASLPCYELMVDTWGRCEARAGSEDIATIAAGAALFPRSILLAYKAALVSARSGNRLQAEQLVQQGLMFATGAADRSRLEQLRSVLEKTDAPGL